MLKTDAYKKTRRLLHFIQFLVILFMLTFLYNFLPINTHATETFYIEGFNTQSVQDSLKENGYKLTFIDKIMLSLDTLPQSGWYTLKKDKVGRYTFFKNIYKHKANTMKIVIYAGETQHEIIQRLANDMKLSPEKLQTFYKRYAAFKEASIFSGHYRVAREANEETLMRYLLRDSKKVLDYFISKSFIHTPDKLEVKILLTIASIIQKESNAIEEMPIISAVIYNRLKKKMRLQMDSTLNYGKFSHTVVTPERIKTDTSYYNTYKHKGLPPHPLASISIDALRAAMFPKACDYLFFMLKPNGKHVFCETYEEHLVNIRTFRAYQKRRDAEKKKKLEEEAKMLVKQRIENNITTENNASTTTPKK